MFELIVFGLMGASFSSVVFLLAHNTNEHNRRQRQLRARKCDPDEPVTLTRREYQQLMALIENPPSRPVKLEAAIAACKQANLDSGCSNIPFWPKTDGGKDD